MDRSNLIELTTEEQAFLKQTLAQLELRGNPNSLRQAIKLIDDIMAKLEQANEKQDKRK